MLRTRATTTRVAMVDAPPGGACDRGAQGSAREADGNAEKVVYSE
jgi:hypothetical protein